MSGLSNACYRVKITDQALKESVKPNIFLYRKFECEIIDKKIEGTVFQAMSDQELGPKLYFQNEEYRIEGFFDGRPMTVWELRNPKMASCAAKAFYDFHNKSGIAAAMETVSPLNKEKLGLDIAIKEWGPAVVEKIARIRSKLEKATISQKEKDELEMYCEWTSRVALFEGYVDFYSDLIDREECVFSHNDAQENNILIAIEDNTNLVLIDYEYGFWNPLTYDLANYVNEYICDNAYPRGTGVTYWHENEATDQEVEYLVKEYFKCSKGDKSGDEIEQSWQEEKDKWLLSTKKNLLLNNYYWGIWSLMMINEKEELDLSIFNWAFLKGRLELIEKQIKWDIFKKE